MTGFFMNMVGQNDDVTFPIENVIALLRFEGADGSTVFTDEMGATWTRFVATISNEQAKYGNTSGKFTADGSYIYNNTIETIGASDFTFALWLYITAGTAPERTVLRFGPSRTYALRMESGSPRQLSWYDGSDDPVGVFVPLNQWSFVSVVCDSTANQIYIGVDGVVGTPTPNAVNMTEAKYHFGGDEFSQEILGYIGEAVIAKTKVVEWMSNYTPPAGPIVAA